MKALEQKGLLGSFHMRGELRFVASNPKTLLAQAEKRTADLKAILPELDALHTKMPRTVRG